MRSFDIELIIYEFTVSDKNGLVRLFHNLSTNTWLYKYT